MKRTCYGCRALSGSQTYRCDLGYRFSPYGSSGPIPLVECPKPRTNAGLVHWLSLKTANGGRAPLFETGDNRHGPK